jgi:hypothetical protein
VDEEWEICKDIIQRVPVEIPINRNPWYDPKCAKITAEKMQQTHRFRNAVLKYREKRRSTVGRNGNGKRNNWRSWWICIHPEKIRKLLSKDKSVQERI